MIARMPEQVDLKLELILASSRPRSCGQIREVSRLTRLSGLGVVVDEGGRARKQPVARPRLISLVSGSWVPSRTKRN